MAAWAAILWCGFGGIVGCSAQINGAPAGAPAFEVASIRLSKPNVPSLPYRIGPDGLSIHGLLKHLVMEAYGIGDNQVAGGPAWSHSESYDIQARAEAPSSKPQLRLMLQALLADRFQLKLHRENRVMAGYVLSVEKGGPRLPPAIAGVPPDVPGVIQLGGGLIWGRSSTMKHLAEGLRLELGAPVVDETSIQGNYDFKLRFEEGNDELKAKPDNNNVNAIPEPAGSIFTSLHELGLRLDSRKVSVEVFVIDSAEKPSEN